MSRFHVLCVVFHAALIGVIGLDTAWADEQPSLEDLMQVEVTSVSRKPERLADVAASVYVITADDIRRSGAKSIPEALRLAPGVDATRIAGNRWSVSIRGFTSILADKLLVLIDGRNAYTPDFSGVFWQDILIPMEDIERIEVIRGAAAATWGTNGVNGVINIITKSTAATQGVRMTGGGGNQAGGYGNGSWGGATDDGTLYYRAYATYQNANAGRAVDDASAFKTQDSYHQASAGLRLDGYLDDGAHWDLTADLFYDSAGSLNFNVTPTGQYNLLGSEVHQGAPISLRYDKALPNGGDIQIEAAYDYTDTQIPYLLTDFRNTADLDVHHRFRWGDNQEIVWGADYRFSSDNEKPSTNFTFDRLSESLTYYGVFGQDDIHLSDSLLLSLGLRFDHNDFTGWAPQPTARLSWNINADQTLWGSVSDVSKAPSQGERGFSFNEDYLPGSPVPDVLVVAHGSDSFGNEYLKTEELGLRSQWGFNISSDATVFHSHYDDLRISGPITENLSQFPLVVADIPIINGGSLTIMGAELAAEWRITPTVQLKLSQTLEDGSNPAPASIEQEGILPRAITSARASWQATSQIDVDAWFRRTDARPAPYDTYLQRNAFSSVDLRIAWRPSSHVELSLSGQNVLNTECDEYKGLGITHEDLNIYPTCLGPSAIAEIRVNY